MIMENGQDSFIDIPTAPIANLLPQKKKIKPWHAPRKQWIRIYQWNAQIEKLIIELQDTQNDPVSDISYLSLPGTELLDIRMVLQLCKTKSVTLKFLGFNDLERECREDITSLNICEAELKKQPNIHIGSVVVKDKLQQLAESKSVAQVALKQFGSLDVINLDLTNCVAHLPPNGPKGDYYRVIHKLFEHQRNLRVKPFLIFLTTRVNTEQVDRTAFDSFLRVLQRNFQLHPSFADKMHTQFGITGVDIIAALDDSKFTVIAKCLDKVFSMALGKWMLNLLLNGNQRWAIEMQESCSYAIRPDSEPDMFSYAFICRPIKQECVDQFGLSGLVANKSVPVEDIELDFAERLIDAVGNVFDLDRRLNRDKQLANELVSAATDLMRQANYDPTHYEQEARQQLEKVSQWLLARDAAVTAQNEDSCSFPV